MLESGLSFLGLGVRPPTASWGGIMRDGADRMLDTWWLLLFPALAIVATVGALHAVGERWRWVLEESLPSAGGDGRRRDDA